jgi:hypothetical protein
MIPVIKRLIVLFVVLVIGATVAYKMDWLSRKGENAYDKTRKAVVKEGEKVIDKTKDAIK